MRRAIQDATACREALLRLPELGLGELRQQWRVLYKAEASPYLSRELLLRAVAKRVLELIAQGEAASGEADWDAAKRQFAGRVTRARLRAMRDQLAPADWKRQGRRSVKAE